MSWEMRKLVRDRELGTHFRKFLLLELADIAEPDGTRIWKSKQTIAAELCCSKPAVIKGLKEFEREGLIRQVGRRACRSGHVIEYALNLDAIRALPKIMKPDADRSTPLTGKLAEPVNVTDVTSKADLPNPSSTHSEAKASGREAPDPVKGVFDLGVSLLGSHGMHEREARSLLGKWRKQRGDREVMAALLECQTKAVSSPAEWLMKRLAPKSSSDSRSFSPPTYRVQNLPVLPTRNQADPTEVAAIARQVSEVLAAGGPVCVR